MLADEVLTPDSSRFWLASQWEPGRPQRSLDKQFLRDWSAGLGLGPAAAGSGRPARGRGRDAGALPGAVHPADLS